jgi:tetratricopeptide (TPR) repeat protein
MRPSFLKYFLLLFLGFSFTGPVLAGFVFNDNCVGVYRDIMDFKIQGARQKLFQEKTLHPENTIIPYLENTADFMEAFVLEERPLFEVYKSRAGKRLKDLELADEKSPYYLFALAEGTMQMAMVRLKFKEYFTAAFEIRKAFKLLEKNAQAFPSFEPNKKSLGFLHALLGAVPEDYKWVLGFGGLKGTVKQGLEELNSVANASHMDNPHFSEEAMFIKIFIELNLQKDKVTAMQLADKLCASNNDNNHLLLSFICSNVAMRTGKNDKAIQILTDRPHKDCLPFYYLDYTTGVAKLNRLDADADVYFKTFIQNFKGKNFIKSACQKLAWHALIQGDTAKYRYYTKLVLSKGAADIDEDIQAQKEATSGEAPNIPLLKIRLLTDGGYYKKAIAVIAANKNAFVRLKDQLELSYRMGRICQEEGNTAKALEYYTSTVSNGKNFNFYFIANAALQLGILFEQTGNYVKARYYYEACLSMKNHEYQHSIDQKAKAGLSRIGVNR